eukprot:CAMPEP_0114580234 /NCGR_PEP_ID=MMETSP0125-20121206/4565_1 /TAXON_ID=485358 ORGANISM="Aristerostoma sp., Strain ATCC 50986" /NCGR_SAMPLE_ID=MMETSP0125 /ASSEMBLY_ACC=CAM_ASM_000245 /LENGTH=141 /DNA_ID=CAMNT_0001771683 /DNA_START=126 /DNA_END=551 /DNA_ORIENTATION=+
MSSLFKHRRVTEETGQEDGLAYNERVLVAGERSPQGPIRFMSQEEKDKVHRVIDLRLKEIEDTGLSKEELLFDNFTGGVPLSRDPFFQLIKKNKLAREVLIEPTEIFTADRIVSLALTQDIGPDPALSRKRNNNLYDHEIN